MSNNIGATIAQLRKERNITQEQLAFIGILILAMELINPPTNFSNYNNSRSLRNYLQAKDNK